MSDSPETLGNLLRNAAQHARITCEKKHQISRVDAVCWFLSRVGPERAREVKRFVTAFKGTLSTYHAVKDFERCYALLNTAYGGVGMDIFGRQRLCLTGSHYGPKAPLYRPAPRHYAITLAGMIRAQRVEAYLKMHNYEF